MKRQMVIKQKSRKSNTSSCTTTSSAISNIRYVECQKNHAANIGGYAIDGCREFMASGNEGTVEALRCAACGCHRNFHRKEVNTEVVCEYSPPNAWFFEDLFLCIWIYRLIFKGEVIYIYLYMTIDVYCILKILYINGSVCDI